MNAYCLRKQKETCITKLNRTSHIDILTHTGIQSNELYVYSLKKKNSVTCWYKMLWNSIFFTSFCSGLLFVPFNLNILSVVTSSFYLEVFMPFAEFLWWLLCYNPFLKVISIFNITQVTLMPDTMSSFPCRLMVQQGKTLKLRHSRAELPTWRRIQAGR